MNRSELIIQIIALATLTIACVLVWVVTTEVFHVEGEILSVPMGIDSGSDLIDRLYSMIPLLCVAMLLSIAFAFYIEEWLSETTWYYRIINQQISILANIPSLIYGILVICIFLFQVKEFLNFTLVLAIVFLVVPVIIRTTQSAIRGVDLSVREAAYALGANRWQVITDHVFPRAFPKITGGIFTVISRVLAIAALLIIVCELRTSIIQDVSSYEISSDVFVLISLALLSCVLSSFLQINRNS